MRVTHAGVMRPSEWFIDPGTPTVIAPVEESTQHLLVKSTLLKRGYTCLFLPLIRA